MTTRRRSLPKLPPHPLEERAERLVRVFWLFYAYQGWYHAFYTLCDRLKAEPVDVYATRAMHSLLCHPLMHEWVRSRQALKIASRYSRAELERGASHTTRLD